ncbi:MAG: methyltransferase [Bacteroidia bacterium]|nr:methyltransferase [Bacteroidia bacterium]
MLRRFLRPFHPLFYRLIKWYYKKPRSFEKRGIKIKLLPSVFHPSYYLSTDILLDYTLSIDLEGKNVLELGCGSAFISLFLAKNTGAKCSASDLNFAAIKGLSENIKTNKVDIEFFHSDLFEDIPRNDFDIILINPPYFEQDPKHDDEIAFYAGKDLQYFAKLFDQLRSRLTADAFALMILSENVNSRKILEVLTRNELLISVVHTIKKNDELFLIYRIYTN